MNRRLASLAVWGAAAVLSHDTVWAQGSLSPPGPPSVTMRSLAEIEPRTPISSVPFTITQPGTYYLTGNLEGTTEGITVSASNVTVDLNGFELVGDRLVPGHGIIVVPSDNVSIRGGVVRDWGGDGVHAPGCSNVVLSELHVARCAGDGIEVGSATLRNVVSEDNDGVGVRAGSGMGGGKVVFQDMHFVRARGNGDGGITYIGPCDASLVDSVVSDNTGHGVAWASTAAGQEGRVRLERCAVDQNTGRGLHIEESALVRVVCSTRGSSFRNNGSDGIAVLLTHADAGLQLDLREGVSNGNGGSGMNVREGAALDNRNVIVEFQFSRNAVDGAAKYDTLAAPSLMSRVVARQNGGRGLALDGGSWTLEQCTVADNGADGVQAVMRTSGSGHVTLMKLADCEVARNGGAGVSIAPDVGGGAYKVSMQDMHVSRNLGGGLSYIGPCDASVTDASVLENTGHGLAWTSLVGGVGTPAAAQRVRLQLRSLRSAGNSLSGLHISEGGEVDVDCDFSSCTFDRNGADGVTLLLTDPDSRLDIVHRGGGASGNAGHGLHLAAGRAARQGFFDIGVSHNGGSGVDKFDAGPGPGTMDRVVAQHNGLHGLDLAGGTWTLDRCVASDNAGGGIVYASRHVRTGHVTLIKQRSCTVERNGGDGLYVHTVENDAGYKVSMQDMHVRSNGGNGVHLSCDTALSSVELDWRDSSASANDGSGVKLIVPVAMDKGLRFRMSGGDCDDNTFSGVDLDTPVGARGSVHAVHFGRNGQHGLVSSAASLSVVRCRFADNTDAGLHVLGGSHHVADNEFADNTVGVLLGATGSTVLRNAFSGVGSGGTPQTPVVDSTGANDVAPPQSAAAGMNPVGNLQF